MMIRLIKFKFLSLMKGLTLICFSSPIIVQAQDNPSDLVKREGLGTSTQSGIEFNGAYSGNRRVTVRGLDAPLEEVLGMMFGLGDKMADNLNDRDRLIYFATKETINDRRFVFAEITDFCRFVLALDTSTDNSIFIVMSLLLGVRARSLSPKRHGGVPCPEARQCARFGGGDQTPGAAAEARNARADARIREPLEIRAMPRLRWALALHDSRAPRRRVARRASGRAAGGVRSGRRAPSPPAP
jgi:hypothetical protein